MNINEELDRLQMVADTAPTIYGDLSACVAFVKQERVRMQEEIDGLRERLKVASKMADIPTSWLLEYVDDAKAMIEDFERIIENRGGNGH